MAKTKNYRGLLGEQEWISRFGISHILDDPNRVLPGQGNHKDHISWLSVHVTLIPPSREQKRPDLWHPDLPTF